MINKAYSVYIGLVYFVCRRNMATLLVDTRAISGARDSATAPPPINLLKYMWYFGVRGAASPPASRFDFLSSLKMNIENIII